MRFPEREVIGAPDCPLMHRWTLWSGTLKVFVHHFLPNTTDPDVHDHPRAFFTLVLRGSYDDMVRCPVCESAFAAEVLNTAREVDPRYRLVDCEACGDTGTVLNEVMRPGMIRRRSARHAHRTRTHTEGCWTLVVMGPLRRPWGFWREGKWWPFKAYEERFGFVMRCEERETERWEFIEQVRGLGEGSE